MIKESAYFSFAGRKSTEFGIYSVSISSGMIDEPLSSSKSITEITVRGNPTPYFVETRREPKQFQLHFSFLEKWNDQLINDVVRWLDVDFYEPLFFSEDIDRVFYCMPTDGIQLIHNGLKDGYLTLTFRCDSPFSYSHEQISPWYQIEDEKIIEIDNMGHHTTLPVIHIHKIGNGSVSIFNLSNGNEELKISNLNDKEEIYLDCENEIIKTNLKNVYRYDDFNENYLELVYGTNILKVKGIANIKFGYRYIFS